MNIRLCVFPTSENPKLIAYTCEYNLRQTLANDIYMLASCAGYKMSNESLNYQITFGSRVLYLRYQHGRSIERILNYITHREHDNIN